MRASGRGQEKKKGSKHESNKHDKGSRSAKKRGRGRAGDEEG